MNNFWIGFIIGGFICGAIGFIGAAILAASGRASRMEERISDSAIHEAAEREEKRRGDYTLEDIRNLKSKIF